MHPVSNGSGYILKLGKISLDGMKIHADASKHKAVSYKRLLELEAQLRNMEVCFHHKKAK